MLVIVVVSLSPLFRHILVHPFTYAALTPLLVYANVRCCPGKAIRVILVVYKAIMECMSFSLSKIKHWSRVPLHRTSFCFFLLSSISIFHFSLVLFLLWRENKNKYLVSYWKMWCARAEDVIFRIHHHHCHLHLFVPHPSNHLLLITSNNNSSSNNGKWKRIFVIFLHFLEMKSKFESRKVNDVIRMNGKTVMTEVYCEKTENWLK